MNGLMLPAPLVTLLNELGIKWPEGDEGKTFEYAQKWFEMGGKVSEARDEGDAGAKKVLEANEGANAEAFRESMEATDGPSKTASGLSTGMQLGGGALIVGAAAILILKVQAIIQLVQLLIKEMQAYAAAGPTFGASLAMIPTWRALAKIAIETATGQTTQTMQGNGGSQPSGSGNPAYGILGELLDGFVNPARRLEGDTSATPPEGTAPLPTEDGGDPMPAEDGGEPVPTENGGEPVPTGNGGEPVPAEDGGEPMPAEDGGEPVPAENGDQPVQGDAESSEVPSYA